MDAASIQGRSKAVSCSFDFPPFTPVIGFRGLVFRRGDPPRISRRLCFQERGKREGMEITTGVKA